MLLKELRELSGTSKGDILCIIILSMSLGAIFDPFIIVIAQTILIILQLHFYNFWKWLYTKMDF